MHRWAQRAPEAEWEVLWAVYYLLRSDMNPEQSGWVSDLAGHAWVWNCVRREPRAILSYVTTYAELVLLDARRTI